MPSAMPVAPLVSSETWSALLILLLLGERVLCLYCKTGSLVFIDLVLIVFGGPV